ncbi:hypothetical protein [Halorubrum sp. T3]|uniref:hypothetical protein n=1 Tax=Halorubrum sp. T3 TaxID=1194088 RepID=UPI000A5210DC|nr:hypothetical protein [Halorubrum sp. T3]
MNQEVHHWESYIYVLATVFLLISLVLVSQFLDAVTAIKGAYALIGVLIAAAVTYGSWWQNSSESGDVAPTCFDSSARLDRWASKGVLFITIGGCLFTYVIGDRLLALVCILIIGFVLVFAQLTVSGSSKSLLVQILLLFVAGPITRYFATGFYFGSRDILGHVKAVQLLIETGRLSGIEAAYPTYSNFPALHVVSASVNAITGLPAYDSVMLLGATGFLIAAAALIYLARTFLSPTETLAVGIVFATLYLAQNYASYFYPQAFATILIICLLYVITRWKSAPPPVRLTLSVTGLVTIVALSLAHHVTQILFAGIVAVLLAPSAVSRMDIGRRLRVNKSIPRKEPLFLALTTGITYLSVTQSGIISYFVQFATARSDDPTVSGSGGARTVLGFGTEIPFQGPVAAFQSLFYVDGLYFIGLTALFVLGFVFVVTRYEQYANIAGFVILGTISSLFVLKTPLLNVARRVALPLAPFFVLIAGIGLARVIRYLRSLLRSKDQREKRGRQMAVLALVVMITVTGPLVAGDDLYGLHSGPNLWESYTTPEPQVDFSQQEFSELEAATGYLDKHVSNVTAISLTRDAFEWFGYRHTSDATVTQSGIRAEGLLAYRTKWTEHQFGATVEPGLPGTIVIADWWLDREVGASNKVYTTGTVGLVQEEPETNLSNI